MSLDRFDPDFIVFLGLGVVLAGFVVVAEVARARWAMPATVTRGFVHMAVGLTVAAAPLFLGGPFYLYVLAGGFTLINAFTASRSWLPGIHGIDRPSRGTVAVPLALLVALAVAWSYDPDRVYALQIAFVVLALADPAAAVAGRRLRSPRFRLGNDVKSLAGSLAFFGVASLSTGALLVGLPEVALRPLSAFETVVLAVGLGVVTAAVEALSQRGWDNFFIVLASLGVLISAGEGAPVGWASAAVLAFSVLFAGTAYRLRFLDASGAVAAGLFAYSTLGPGGVPWAVPAFVFFLLSSLLSRVGRGRKAAAEARAEKGSVRDAGQVFANGGVAWALLGLHVAFPWEGWYWGFAGAFAAAAADTWATELGTLSRRLPRMITTGRAVPSGTSGAVSLAGVLGSAAGAASVAAGGVLFVPGAEAWAFFLTGLVGGVGAGLLDSLAGATVQGVYRDPETGGLTERRPGPAAVPVRGWRAMTNDRVNWVCTVGGGLIALLGFIVYGG